MLYTHSNPDFDQSDGFFVWYNVASGSKVII